MIALPLRMALAPALALLLSLLPALGDDPVQKRIVIDFEDVGTWRMDAGSTGTKPQAWWAGVSYLSGSAKEKRHDNYVGELKFAFDPAQPAPYRVSYLRQKMTLVSGFLDGIEFDADSQGLPVSVRFVIGDSAGKKFTTAAAALQGGWASYRIDINEKTLPHFADCRFPAHLERIVMESSQPCEGSIFLDDVALTGDFARRDQLWIFPVADLTTLALPPDQPVTLRYRLRNAKAAPLPVTTKIVVRDFSGREVFSGQRNDTVPAYGQATAEFSLPALSIGPYAAAVTADAGSFQVAYDDPFGVFVPNGKRLNHRAMWFGVGDGANWHGEEENTLHIGWMRQLGVDLNRIEATATRLEPKPGVFGFEGWKKIFDAYGAADIGLEMIYSTTPVWTLHPGSHDVSQAPEDMDAYGKHVAAVANFLKDFPAIKYVEFWNEPDAGNSPDTGFFHGDLDGYLRMFAVFSREMRAAAPAIKITNAGLCVIHPKERPGFPDGVVQKGAPLYDVASFHAHGPLANYEERQLVMEKWMRDAGVDKPIGNTESGERSGYDPVGRVVQAVTLVKKITYAKSRPKSEYYMWFTLKDYWDMDPKADDSFGMITSDDRIKPSFLAYNALIKELADTVPADPVTLDDRIQTYAFRRDDGSRVYVCWPKPGASGGLVWLKSAQPVTRTDMFGRSETSGSLGGLVPVGLDSQPVYLDTPPGSAVLVAAKPEERFLDLGGEINLPIGREGSFPIRLRNPEKGALTGELAFEDGDGKKAWSKPVSLASGAELNADVPVPASDGLRSRTGAVTLRLDGGKPSLRFPVTLTPSYPIARAEGNPLASDLGSFVQQLPALVLNRQQDVFELAFDPAIPPWHGADDLSVTARVCHDDGGIYFRFDVTDDKHVQNSSADRLWLGDSVQVAVAAPGQKRYAGFALGLLKDGPAVWCSDNPDPQAKGRWDVPVRIERRGTVTSYQVYVPFSKLGIAYKPGETQPVRFAFLVNEDDGQGRVRWMHWYDGIGKGQDTDVLGYGTLEGK